MANFSGDNSVKIVCLPSATGSPLGSEFFPSRVETFSDGYQKAGVNTANHATKVVSLVKMAENLPDVKRPI